MHEMDPEDPFCGRSELSGLSAGGVEPGKRKPWKMQGRAEALSGGRIQRNQEAQVERSTRPSATEHGEEPRADDTSPSLGRHTCPEDSPCETLTLQ